MTEDTDRAKKQQQLAAARRMLAHLEAKDSLLRYIQLQFPDPEQPDDVTASRYIVSPQARLLCEIMEQCERGELKRVAISIGPQTGKSEVITRRAPAWISGRNPRRHLLVGAYNQTFADEFGYEVRQSIQSQMHRAVFPTHRLDKGSSSLLITPEGGKTGFIGIGGSGSGKPADGFIVEDPLRGDADAQSPAKREEVWKWFTGVVLARARVRTWIVVVHTRWHQDDLIGRLCDPDHPERNKLYKGIADRWKYINLPAVIEDPKLAKALGLTLEMPTDPSVISMFGLKPMAPLYPQELPLEILAEKKETDSRAFNALYMGKPTPEDGEFFKADMLVPYQAHELPAQLRYYGASDHAVSEKQDRDYTVLGCVGVDEHDTMWVLPDVVIDRMETDRTVEEMLLQFRMHKPDLWWMESELISKSFGPFLQKRMLEQKTYVTIDPVTVSKDKRLRARAIQGRMSMKKVRFPVFAPWWAEMRAQILRFPYGAHDDFVDWLAHIGMGLLKETRASVAPANDDKVVQVGSMRWILAAAAARARTDDRKKALGGW